MIKTVEEERFLAALDPCQVDGQECFYWDAAPLQCKNCDRYDSMLKFNIGVELMLEDFRNNIWTM